MKISAGVPGWKRGRLRMVRMAWGSTRSPLPPPGPQRRVQRERRSRTDDAVGAAGHAGDLDRLLGERQRARGGHGRTDGRRSSDGAKDEQTEKPHACAIGASVCEPYAVRQSDEGSGSAFRRATQLNPGASDQRWRAAGQAAECTPAA